MQISWIRYKYILLIKNVEIANPKRIPKLESRIDNVEDEIISSLEGLDDKYKLLKDQVTALSKVIEEEKATKEAAKKKHFDDMNLLETKIKKYVLDDRDVIFLI